MPILAVDANGNIYATSRDRADGRGFGETPTCVSEGDLTLGSAYLKSAAKRREELLNRRYAEQLQDREDAANEHAAQMGRRENRRRLALEAKMMESPRLQSALTRRAVMQGCKCSEELNTGMNGNGLSHNGQTGWRGMSRDQQTIHHALSGMGANTAFYVDPTEEEQMRHKIEAQRILRLQARR